MNADELKRRAEQLADRWPEAEPAERRHLLDNVGGKLADSFEAPAPPIFERQFESADLLARYDDAQFRIEINSQLFEDADPASALDAYLHEYRHAAQSYEILKSHGALAHEVDIEQALRFEKNREAYITPDADFEGYLRQPLEADARAESERLRRELFDTGGKSKS